MNDTAIALLVFLFFKKIILQNMLRSLHTSSSVVHIKSTVNFHTRRVLLQCYSIALTSFNCFIHYFCIYCHGNCQIKLFKCIFNNTVTL